MWAWRFPLPDVSLIILLYRLIWATVVPFSYYRFLDIKVFVDALLSPPKLVLGLVWRKSLLLKPPKRVGIGDLARSYSFVATCAGFGSSSVRLFCWVWVAVRRVTYPFSLTPLPSSEPEWTGSTIWSFFGLLCLITPVLGLNLSLTPIWPTKSMGVRSTFSCKILGSFFCSWLFWDKTRSVCYSADVTLNLKFFGLRISPL